MKNITVSEIQKIMLEKTSNYYQVFAIRGDDRVLEIGKKLECSRDMRDEMYDHESGEYPLLPGTSATAFGWMWNDGGEEDREEIQRTLDFNREYSYNHRYLVAGTGYEYGDDEKEIVIYNAEVMAIFE